MRSFILVRIISIQVYSYQISDCEQHLLFFQQEKQNKMEMENLLDQVRQVRTVMGGK